ncbi:MAG: hypothetical protein WD048_01910 [Chitinophagales bacterium]
MSNNVFYTIITMLLLLVLGLYANEVRKKTFLKDDNFACVMQMKCDDHFIPSARFTKRLENEFLCEGLVNKYKMNTEDEYVFFIEFMRLSGIVSNDILLNKKPDYYSARVLQNHDVIAEIRFNFKKGDFRLLKVEGFCNVFKEVDCFLEQ